MSIKELYFMLNFKTSAMALTLGAALLAPNLAIASGSVCLHDAADHCQTVTSVKHYDNDKNHDKDHDSDHKHKNHKDNDGKKVEHKDDDKKAKDCDKTPVRHVPAHVATPSPTP